jgi:hypothetical protein
MDDPWEFLQTDDELAAHERTDPPAEIAALHIITPGGQLDVRETRTGARGAQFFADEDTGEAPSPAPEVEEDIQALLERQHYAV